MLRPDNEAVTPWFVPLCVIGAAFQLSCGAGDRPGAFVPSGRAEASCPAIDAFAPNLVKFMRNDGFEPIAEVIEQELIPSGAMREAIASFLRLAKAAPPPSGILEPVAALLSEERVEPAVALSRNALYYIAGHPPAKAAHYEVPAVLGAMLSQCDPASVLTLGEILLSTHVPLGCEPGSEGCKLGTIALINPMHDLLADPTLRSVLTLISFAQVPEDAFVAILDQVANLLKSPAFDFQELRALLQRLVYPFIFDDELRQKLDALLDVLSVLTAPEVGLMDSLRETLICVDLKDPNRALHRMIYNLIVDPEFQLSELVAAIGATEALDPDERVARWLIQVIGMLKRDPASHRAILGLTARLFEEKNAKRIVPTLIAIKDAGLADDLVNLFDRETSACK